MGRIIKFFVIFLIYGLTGVAYTSESSEISFAKTKLKLGGQIIVVEMAKNPEQQARGLMFRKELPPNHGMLFVYESEDVLNFWMKNTFIPLAIGFFDKNKKLVDIQEMEPVSSEMQLKIPTYQAKESAQYALEMPAGWFKQNKVQLGAKFEFVP